MLKRLLTVLRLKRSELRSKVRRTILGPHAAGVLVENAQGLFLAAPDDISVGWQLTQHGTYGLEILEVLEPLITKQSNVLVAGAHIGSIAIPLAKKAANVTAFEANPKTFHLLELNKRLNDSGNLIVHPLALGSSSGMLKFLLNSANSGGSKRVPLHKGDYYHDKPQVIEVPMVALDEFMPDAAFDVILMDIEGSEPDALRGMQRILKTTQHLLVEYLPHHLDHVAGVTDDEFVSLLSPHFNRVHLAGNPAGESRDLAAFVKNIRNTLSGGDLLFSK